MIETIKLANLEPDSNPRLQRILGRTAGLDADVLVRAEAVVRDVRARGDAALIDYTNRFDGVSLTPQTLAASRDQIEESAPRFRQISSTPCAKRSRTSGTITSTKRQSIGRLSVRMVSAWVNAWQRSRTSVFMYREDPPLILRR
jgi:hypothetical protein